MTIADSRSPSLILASSSPRRAAILRQIGLEFTVRPANIDETARPDEEAGTMCQRLARTKAEAVHQSQPQCAVLGADTLIEFNGEILGKPRDADHGRQMLARMAGRRHRVHTAVAVLAPGGECHEALTTSVVTLRPITSDEIAAYWASGEPADKAGGYAIQGLGGLFVSHLDGSGSAVAGLDCCRTAELLRAADISVLGS